MSLLEVRNLKTRFHTEAGFIYPTNDISFSVDSGEIVALVGESGSGKSVTSRAVLQLVEPKKAIVDGEILFDGIPIRDLTPAALRELRGSDISMVFQDPMASLNPVLTIGEQLEKVYLSHFYCKKGAKELVKSARARAVELLGKVGISDPLHRLKQYPHEFSGGMRQRVLIAMALMCSPRLLFADEPTTALDVTVEMQVLRLLRSLQQEYGMAIVFITHNLGAVAQLCDRVMVMYAGKIVEQGSTREVFRSPLHPYTRALLQSYPSGRRTDKKLHPIQGEPPNLADLPQGCSFQPRCNYAVPECCEIQKLRTHSLGRKVACHKASLEAFTGD